MKKNKHTHATAKKKTGQPKLETTSEDPDKNAGKVDSLDDEERGFGGWLRSSDGMETMKLFVIANSIVMVTTLAYPHVQTIFEILSEMIYGTDTLY